MDGGVGVDPGLRIAGESTYLVPFSDRHRDDPAYLEWLRDYDVVRAIGRPEYLTGVSRDEIVAYVARLKASDSDLFFAIHAAIEDVFIGTVKAGHIDKTAGIADIGIMIGRRDHWGRGFATDALAALCGYMFKEYRIRKLTCGVMASNPAMAHVFEKLGFRREASLRNQVPFEGGFVDHFLYGCFADELRTESSRPAQMNRSNRP